MTSVLASDPIPAFFGACDLAAGLVGSNAVAERWDHDSAIEAFTVGALAAHMYAAIRLFESALEQPEPSSPRAVVDMADFYGLNRIDDRCQLQDTLQIAIREDAVRRAEQGPTVVAEKFASLVGRLQASLPGLSMDRLVPVWRVEGGATHLSDYLVTRVVELVVHADDLAVSLGIEIDLPEEAAAVAFAAFVDLARARSGDVAVLRAFTRRERADPEVLRVL